MKQTLLTSLKLTLALAAILAVGYALPLRGFAEIAGPGNGAPEYVRDAGGNVVGAALVGQRFTKAVYFWGRPSAGGYAADASGGSNKGPGNPEWLREVEARVAAFLAAHPYLKRSDVPAEMVTASGSGLDPDISPRAACVQIRRVAEARGVPESEIAEIVAECTRPPLLGLFGPAKINVLKLNLALDAKFPAAGTE